MFETVTKINTQGSIRLSIKTKNNQKANEFKTKTKTKLLTSVLDNTRIRGVLEYEINTKGIPIKIKINTKQSKIKRN